MNTVQENLIKLMQLRAMNALIIGMTRYAQAAEVEVQVNPQAPQAERSVLLL